jgi:hypothetical protein
MSSIEPRSHIAVVGAGSTVAALHRPVIRGTDHAIWRQVRLIPFDVTIPPAERCVLAETATSKALFAACRAWCEETGEKAVSQRAFANRLVEQGFKSARGTKGRVCGKASDWWITRCDGLGDAGDACDAIILYIARNRKFEIVDISRCG